MLEKSLKFIINNAKITLFATVFICIFISLFSFKLTVDASAESLLLEDDEDLKIYRELSSHFASEDFLILAYDSNDKTFDKENLIKNEILAQELTKIGGVKSVLNITNAILLNSDDLSLQDKLAVLPNILSKDTNLSRAKKELLSHPFYTNNIISKDAKTTAFIIYLKKDTRYNELIKLRDEASNENEKESYRTELKKHQENEIKKQEKLIKDIRELIAKQDDKDKFYLGGIRMIADDMIYYIKKDMLYYSFALVFILALALWYFFRTARFVFLPLFISFISLSTVSGIFALLDFRLTVISSNFVPLVLIISLSLSIHLSTHFIEYSHKFKQSSTKKVLLATLLSKAKPSFYAILTTVIGFLSLIFSNINPIINLGIMMSVGICISLILCYVLFASILSILPKKEYCIRYTRLSFLKKLGKISIKKRVFVYTISLFIILLALLGISKLKVENSFVNYFKDNSEIKKGMLKIDEKLGGTIPLDVIIKFKEDEKQDSKTLDSFEAEFEELGKNDTYFFNSHKKRIAKKVHTFLQDREFVGSVLSLNSLLELGKIMNDGKELDDFTLAFLNENLNSDFKEQLLKPYVSIENNELRFSMRILDSDENLNRDEFIKNLKIDLENLLKDENVEIYITNVMLLYNNMLQSLFSSQFDTLIFVVLAIFLVFIYVFKSVKMAFLAIIANLIPLSLIFALMGFLGIALDFMSITISAIAIGIGVDDSIHYIHRFMKERQKKSLFKSILTSHSQIGAALLYTTVTVVLGFGIMLTSEFIPTITFALLIIFVMLCLMLGTLILLASLLSSFYKEVKKNK